MTQLQPHLLVSGVAVRGFVAWQVVDVAFNDVWLGIVNKSVRGSGTPFPRSRSLNIIVLADPSVASAKRTPLGE